MCAWTKLNGSSLCSLCFFCDSARVVSVGLEVSADEERGELQVLVVHVGHFALADALLHRRDRLGILDPARVAEAVWRTR